MSPAERTAQLEALVSDLDHTLVMAMNGSIFAWRWASAAFCLAAIIGAVGAYYDAISVYTPAYPAFCIILCMKKASRIRRKLTGYRLAMAEFVKSSAPQHG